MKQGIKLSYNRGKKEFEAMARVESASGCWVWTGGVDSNGYGHWQFQGAIRRCHHISLYLYKDIPFVSYNNRIHVDHLCRNRPCVNPDHLEVVSAKENITRGEGPAGRNHRAIQCKNGHPFTEENTRIRRTVSGYGRQCRLCSKARGLKSYKKSSAKFVAMGLTSHGKPRVVRLQKNGTPMQPGICSSGHEMVGDNLRFYQKKGGWIERRCRTCDRQRNKDQRKARAIKERADYATE
jgi:hypothetical protein